MMVPPPACKGQTPDGRILAKRKPTASIYVSASNDSSKFPYPSPLPSGHTGGRFYLARVLIAFNKPYGVLAQFTPESPGHRTLAEFDFPKRVYPIGRLDADSEGLLLLSDEGPLNERLLHPRHGHEREYWAQVEGIPAAQDLQRLQRGVIIQGRKTLPCRAWHLEPQPQIAPRDPPIRFRKTVPTCWLALQLLEGKNRQVRRMTAAIGYPTLRLIRTRIGGFRLNQLLPGKWRILTPAERQLVFS